MMPTLRGMCPARLPDGRVILNSHHLKTARKHLGLSQEALSEQCAERHLCLSLASIKRAETGKPVLYRTARQFAAFYGVVLTSLMQPAHPVSPASAARQYHVERRQLATAIETAGLLGCAQLIDLRGAAGSGKSTLLRSFAADAQQSGARYVALGVDGAEDGWLADLLPSASPARPLVLGIDDVHRAGPVAAALIARWLSATRHLPVVWVLASDGASHGAPGGVAACLEHLTRTVLQLGPEAQDAGHEKNGHALRGRSLFSLPARH